MGTVVQDDLRLATQSFERTLSSSTDENSQYEELKRRMPNVRTSLSSTMPVMSLSNADQLAALANSKSSNDTSPLQPPSGGAGSGGTGSQAFFSNVDKGYNDGKDNGSALKASGYRVMDDMAVHGMGQGRGKAGIDTGRIGSKANGSGISTSTRSMDTSALMSPLKTGKKKKLGTKGSSSAKGRGN